MTRSSTAEHKGWWDPKCPHTLPSQAAATNGSYSCHSKSESPLHQYSQKLSYDVRRLQMLMFLLSVIKPMTAPQDSVPACCSISGTHALQDTAMFPCSEALQRLQSNSRKSLKATEKWPGFCCKSRIPARTGLQLN